ncbi:protein of unknown function [Spirosomataceae bacterium TFI 002]|nr:protein of unknown function [Spirosomataceae bacterium TFI 002]
MKYLQIVILILILSACIEKYDFNVENENKGIVVEAQFSNKSFEDTKLYPSEGRYFQLKLSHTSDVDNIRDDKISGARILLIDSDGNEYMYTETTAEGIYELKYPNLRAEDGKKYKLSITLEEGQMFESRWESVNHSGNKLGEFSFKETQKETYVFTYDKKDIKTLNGINLAINIPKKENKEPIFYKWKFEPLWVFRASLPPENSPVKQCWVTSDYYLNDFVLLKDNFGGGFNQNLFFLQIKENDKTYVYFSTLVIQEELSEDYFNFWKDFQAQKEKGGLFDQPPFGLPTNLKPTNNNWTVNGFFGIVNEEAIRWELDPLALSYVIKNNLDYLCNLPQGPPVPGKPSDCKDCRSYSDGISVTKEPSWWNKNLNLGEK